jgi:hypothetical protein
MKLIEAIVAFGRRVHDYMTTSVYHVQRIENDLVESIHSANSYSTDHANTLVQEVETKAFNTTKALVREMDRVEDNIHARIDARDESFEKRIAELRAEFQARHEADLAQVKAALVWLDQVKRGAFGLGDRYEPPTLLKDGK